jgi:hypothetical protein
MSVDQRIASKIQRRGIDYRNTHDTLFLIELEQKSRKLIE